MSYTFRKAFVKAEGFANHTLIVGQAGDMNLPTRAPAPYRALNGGDGVLRSPSAMPLSGVVQIELMTDDPVLIEIIDFAGKTIYSQVVAKEFATDGIEVSDVAGDDEVDMLVDEVELSVEEGDDGTANVTLVLGDGTTEAAAAGVTAESSDEGVATVAYAAGVVTVTGVAEGTAVITVSYDLSSGQTVTRTINVTVTPAA